MLLPVQCSWFSNQSLNNGNRTKWTPIRSVIIRVINKIGWPHSRNLICLITSMSTDWIGWQEVLLPIILIMTTTKFGRFGRWAPFAMRWAAVALSSDCSNFLYCWLWFWPTQTMSKYHHDSLFFISFRTRVQLWAISLFRSWLVVGQFQNLCQNFVWVASVPVVAL